jgi:6-phosphogluconolactonase
VHAACKSERPLSLSRQPRLRHCPDGKDIFPGGENNIAVFAIDQQTGEPMPQYEDVLRGLSAQLSARSELAHAGCNRCRAELTRDGASFKTIPANIWTFRVGNERQAHLCPQNEIGTGGELQF